MTTILNIVSPPLCLVSTFRLSLAYNIHDSSNRMLLWVTLLVIGQGDEDTYPSINPTHSSHILIWDRE